MGRHTLTVLLIEDCAEYAYLVQHWLSGTCVNLEWLGTLSAGACRLETGGVDVILLDLGLPDSQGLDTYTRIRASALETPIVVLGSADLDPITLGAIQNGTDDFLIKNACGAEMLVRALSNAVQSSGRPHPAGVQERVAIPVPADLPRELVTEYLDDCGNTLIELREALINRSYERAKVCGHGLKGTGSPYGFPVLTQIGAAIEQAAASHEAFELERQVNRLGEYLERVELV